MLFVLCLLAVAAALGVAASSLLARAETELAEEQFSAIAGKALASVRANTLRMRNGMAVLASVFSNAHPDAAKWPYVALDGFDEIASDLIKTASNNFEEVSTGTSFTFMPLVYPHQVGQFESFAYGYVKNESIGVSSFGRGVYAIDPSSSSLDKRYHDTTGATSWGDDEDDDDRYLTPIFQFKKDAPNAKDGFMFNLHCIESRGRLFDEVRRCAERRKLSQDYSTVCCTSISDALFLLRPASGGSGDSGLGAIMTHPIYPANNRTQVRIAVFLLKKIAERFRFTDQLMPHSHLCTLLLLHRKNRSRGSSAPPSSGARPWSTCSTRRWTASCAFWKPSRRPSPTAFKTASPTTCT